MTAFQRTSIDNAIWLCQSCAKLIDNDPAKYTVTVLVTWRLDAEASAERALVGTDDANFYPQPIAANHIPIPRIYGLPYEDARLRLIRAGWQPRQHHWTHAGTSDMTCGNGLYFWEKGYHEIQHSSGTGLAHCTFFFTDVYGTALTIVTAGEMIPELGATARVWNWYIRNERDA